MSRSLEGTKTALLCHTIVRGHLKVHRRVVHFWINGGAGVIAELRSVVQEKDRGIGASSSGFVQRIDEISFFGGRCNTDYEKRVNWMGANI